MKSKINKLTCISFIIVSIMLLTNLSANAHEMYLDGTTPINLKFTIKSSDGLYYHTKVNDDLLSDKTVYRDNVSQAIANWNNSTTKAKCTYDSYQNSNVDLATMTKEYWDQNGYPSNGLAITWLIDTSGAWVRSSSEAKTSAKSIKGAIIYFNPYMDKNGIGIAPIIAGNQTQQLGVIVHEIGHVYTLGHCDTLYDIVSSSTKSVMRAQATLTMPTTLQQHDLNDMNAKYK